MKNEQPQNKQTRRITVAEMAPHVHSFASGENKVDKITKWIESWIKTSLESETIKPYDYLPLKGDLAFHIGVSLGTMQNVFRCLEDAGIVESKQRVGTYIAPQTTSIEKLTSKREVGVNLIKKYIVENDIKEGKKLPSTRKLAILTGMSSATIRNAINTLIQEGIIKKEKNSFSVKCAAFDNEEIKTVTLVEKVALKIKNYIQLNLSSGDKLPSNNEFAEKFGVSVKTIHDAVKKLVSEGILVTKRGQYGTLVANIETTIEPYFYEKAELKIKNYISQNCKIGAKLPTIKEFARMLSVSMKTIKKALDNISEDGFITFTRGRYGGTFVVDIPQINESYKWLALSPNYIKLDDN